MTLTRRGRDCLCHGFQIQAASTGEYDRGLHPANAVARPLLQATTAIRFEEEIVVSGSERVAGCIYFRL
jgi:hypothetical protein